MKRVSLSNLSNYRTASAVAQLLWPILLFVCCSGSAANVPSTNPNGDLSAVIRGVAQAERALQNLRVDAKTRVEDRADAGDWSFAGGSDVTAFYDGFPGGKQRIDYHSHISKWVNGPHPFGEDVFSVAYNGRIGTKLYTQMGTAETKQAPAQGWIERDPPMLIKDIGNFAGGWQFSLYGLYDREGIRASEVWSKIPGVSAVADTVNGIPCVKISNVNERSKTLFEWWLDPSQDYAVIKLQTLRGNGVVDRVVVEKLENPAPGVHYPARALRELGPATRPVQRITYAATRIVANDPSFPPGIFTIKFPSAARIEDTISGQTFIAGRDDQELAQAINAQVQDVKESLKSPPPAPPSPEGRAWWIVSLCVVAGALVAALLIRSARRRTTILLLAAMAYSGSSLRASETDLPLSMRELSGFNLDNCGLSVTSFVLNYFDVPLDMPGLEKDLATGTNRQNFVSLDAIKRCLDGRGLSCKAFKAARVEDIWPTLSPESAIIVYAQPVERPSGHFYVMLGRTNGYVAFIDPGHKFQWVKERDLEVRLKEAFGGIWLVVTQANVKSNPIRSLLEARSAFTEETTTGEGELAIPLRFNNPGGEVVSVKSSRGDCGCFRGIRPAGFSLASAGTGTLELLFDRAAFHLGEEERGIILELAVGSRA